MPRGSRGLSDASLGNLRAVAAQCDVDVFTSASTPTIIESWTAWPFSAYERQARRAPYALNIYEMGNDFAAYEEIFDVALREPGLVLLRDQSLYTFYVSGSGARRHLLDDEIRFAHGVATWESWQRHIDRRDGVDPLTYHLLRRLAMRSRALIAHSAWGRDCLREQAPATPVYHIPLATSEAPCPANRAAIRSVLCIPDDALIVGMFGELSAARRIPTIVAALAAAPAQHPDIYLLVGYDQATTGNDVLRIHAAVLEHGLERQTRFQPVSLGIDELRFMQACDVIVDLQWPAVGQPSPTLAQAVGLGKLVMTSDTPQAREFDDRFCWRIPHDESEHGELVSAFQRITDEPAALETARRAAEQYTRDVANPHAVARAYATVIAELTAPDLTAPDLTAPDAQPHTRFHSNGTARAAQGTPAETSADMRARAHGNPLREVAGLNCIGDISTDDGRGIEASQMMRAILQEQIPAAFIESAVTSSPSHNPIARELVRGLPAAPKYPTSLLLRNIHDVPSISNAEMERLSGGKYLIGRWFWELAQLPEEWASRFERFDEVWVSSRFNQEAMQAVTARPITVIPATVEVPVSERVTRAAFGLPEDRFLFLFTFAASSVAGRKNPFGLIDAFERAFGRPAGDGAPLLVIKAHHLDLPVDEFRRLRQDLRAAVERVGGVLLTQNYTRQETNDLLSCADCYVSLHRAEGFGLGMAESMYLGKPTIGTNYSGNVDFMTPDNSYLVDYQLREITAATEMYNPLGREIYKPGFIWAEPDLDHAARLMRQVYENPQERRERGARAASDIRAQLSSAAVGRLIRKRLAEIEREQLVSTRERHQIVVNATASIPPRFAATLQHSADAIGSLEWSRTRDRAVPFQQVKRVGTAMRVLARVVVQGRINEQQQFINTDVQQLLRSLAQEVGELKRAAEHARLAHDARITALKSDMRAAEEERGKLAGYVLQFGSVFHAAAERVPQLTTIERMVVSEEVDGRVHILSGAVPDGVAVPFTDASVWPEPADEAASDGIIWLHRVQQAQPGDWASFFRHVAHRLRAQDVVVLLTPAAPSEPPDAGMLQMLYDAPIPGEGRAMILRRAHTQVCGRNE